MSESAMGQILAGAQRVAELERQMSEQILAAARTACAAVGTALKASRDQFDLTD